MPARPLFAGGIKGGGVGVQEVGRARLVSQVCSLNSPATATEGRVRVVGRVLYSVRCAVRDHARNLPGILCKALHLEKVQGEMIEFDARFQTAHFLIRISDVW